MTSLLLYPLTGHLFPETLEKDNILIDILLHPPYNVSYWFGGEMI